MSVLGDMALKEEDGLLRRGYYRRGWVNETRLLEKRTDYQCKDVEEDG